MGTCSGERQQACKVSVWHTDVCTQTYLVRAQQGQFLKPCAQHLVDFISKTAELHAATTIR